MSKDIEILIVEESLTQAEHLKHILEQHAHPVAVAHNAEAALAAIRARPPQVVISAVLLPVMDGYELCRQIKADAQLKDIPVILLTSLSDPTDIIRGLECGADNFVTKPYDEKLLLSRIEYIVLNRELRGGAGTQTGLEIIFNGQKYSITPERQQMVDLLISTYELAVQKNLELLRVQQELNALNERLEEKVEARTAQLQAEVVDRRAVAAALTESEARYRTLGAASAQVMWHTNAAGEIQFGNSLWQDLTGQNEAEMSGWGWLDALHPESREQTTRLWQQALATKNFYEDEQHVRTRDGSYCTFRVRAAPILEDDGEVREWVGTHTDITERKRAEEALRAQQRILREVIDANPNIIFVKDEEGRYTLVNQAMAELFGTTVESVVGKTAADFMSNEEDAERIYRQDEEVRASAQSMAIPEEPITDRRTGEVRWFQTVKKPLVSQGGQVHQVLAVATDITERKQAEQALIESEVRLQQSQKMEAIGTLTGGVAHDFNNLLTVILGNTQLALRKLAPDDPTQLRLVEIEKAGDRAAVLTRQLLAFSRRQILERRTINLNDIIGEIVKLLQRIIGEDVEMRVQYAPKLAAVFADPAQVEQVLMNLCVNARDAMPGGGQLTIETSNVELDETYRRQYPYVQPGRYVQLRVSDTGAGMDAATQAHIFEPYFTTKEVGKGTGLGLSMVYGIVKQHDGHINVYSEVGQGTTFNVFLPVDEQAVAQERQALQLPLLGGPETILVAEDEAALRVLARDVLESLGYTVLMAQNGEEAVELYAAQPERIDLLLFDVVMPRMGGWEAYEQIRQLGRRVPLIFVTGYSSETVQSRFVKPNKLLEDLGSVVMQKPYSLEGLGRKVREVLDQAQGQ